ncbi:hypothetical protein LSUE1_G000816 [Lachnellula suecica]|uniref:Major facilitator superfamily (MFS) profile domain-containing protein n=1 Tax=Lachnellula suecica TaxID=602035 RepID=A0A8T9CFX9_9HELO|nr:hypothetical protein LSUE1_G000816 [Lachnellula suecica]
MTGNTSTGSETLKGNEGMEVTPVEDATHEAEVTAGPIVKLDSYKDDRHISLTWRSWMVVFIANSERNTGTNDKASIMTQVYVVVAAGSVIGFIIRDLGEASIAGWIIQGPLLIQSVLSPIVGRLSDVLDRKYIAIALTVISFAGAIVSAKAKNMSDLIGGGILVGCTLATTSIVQAIPSEVLPLKYRALANGFAFIGGSFGGM